MNGPGPTVVGGRPPEIPSQQSGFPRGVEQFIIAAARNSSLLEEFRTSRLKAIDQANLNLSPIESSILLTIPLVQLESIVKRYQPAKPERRSFLKMAAGLAGALILGHRASAKQNYDADIPVVTPEPTSTFSYGIQPTPTDTPVPAGIVPSETPPPPATWTPTPSPVGITNTPTRTPTKTATSTQYATPTEIVPVGITTTPWWPTDTPSSPTPIPQPFTPATGLIGVLALVTGFSLLLLRKLHGSEDQDISTNG